MNSLQHIKGSRFKDFVVEVKSHPLLGGIQVIIKFPNGYGASVVMNGMSYGLELGVIKFDKNGIFALTCDTPVTDDVIGFIENVNELDGILEQIKNLA